MRIAVVGTGNIGRTIGGAWERAGHEVAYTSRTPEPPETVAITDALLEAQVVLLAIPGGGVEQFLIDHGHGLAGRLVFDATNRIGEHTLHNAEAFAEHAPEALLVRAFNSVGWEVMADPGEAAMFWCGPDGDPGATAAQLIADVGLRPVRVGGLDVIEVVDGAGRLWLTLVFGQGMPRTIALQLIGA